MCAGEVRGYWYLDAQAIKCPNGEKRNTEAFVFSAAMFILVLFLFFVINNLIRPFYPVFDAVLLTYQDIGLITLFWFDWNERLSRVFFVFRVALLDVDVYEPTCAIEWGFNEAFRMMLLLPILMAGVNACGYACKLQSRDEGISNSLSFFINAQASLLYYCSSVFSCRNIHPANKKYRRPSGNLARRSWRRYVLREPCLLVLALLCPSRGRRWHAKAAKIIEHGLRLVELGPRRYYVEELDASCTTTSTTVMRVISSLYLLLIAAVTTLIFRRLAQAAARDELNSQTVLERYGFMYRGRRRNLSLSPSLSPSLLVKRCPFSRFLSACGAAATRPADVPPPRRRHNPRPRRCRDPPGHHTAATAPRRRRDVAATSLERLERRYKSFRMGALWWGVLRLAKQACLVLIVTIAWRSPEDQTLWTVIVLASSRGRAEIFRLGDPILAASTEYPLAATRLRGRPPRNDAIAGTAWPPRGTGPTRTRPSTSASSRVLVFH